MHVSASARPSSRARADRSGARLCACVAAPRRFPPPRVLACVCLRAHPTAAFQLHLSDSIQPGLATVGKYDGEHPCLTAATTGGKIFVHNPHRARQVRSVLPADACQRARARAAAPLRLRVRARERL